MYGVIGGMGLGGGIILIPAFTIFFGFGQHEAQAVNLAVFLPMALAALVLHIKQKRVRFKNMAVLLAGGIAGAALGSLLSFITAGDLLKKAFGVFLIIIAGIRVYQFEYAAGKKRFTAIILF